MRGVILLLALGSGLNAAEASNFGFDSATSSFSGVSSDEFAVAATTRSSADQTLVGILACNAGRFSWREGTAVPSCENSQALEFLWQTVAIRSGEGFDFASKVVGACQFKRAIPDLRSALEDPRFRLESALGLYFMGDSLDEVVPIISKELAATEARQRFYILRMIGFARHLRPVPNGLIPAIATLLNDPVESVRRSAVKVLFEMPVVPKYVAPSLIRNLTHSQPAIRLTSACALLKAGENLSEAIEVLKKDVLDPNSKLYGIACLSKMDTPESRELMRLGCNSSISGWSCGDKWKR